MQALLVAGGGALQIAGVLLAAWDIWDAYRQWRAYEHRDQVVEPGTIQLHLQAFAPSVIVDPPPTIEDRMTSAEARMSQLQDQMEEVTAQQRRERDERMAMTAGALTRMVRREDEALARLFRAVLIGGWRRLVAVGCFLLGTAAATVGSLPIWG